MAHGVAVVSQAASIAAFEEPYNTAANSTLYHPQLT